MDNNLKELIQYSNLYGHIGKNSKVFDDSKDLGDDYDDDNKENIFQYKIKIIKIYTKEITKKNAIYSIQIIYKNIINNELIELPLRVDNTEILKSEDTEVFELKSGEYLTNFYIRFDMKKEYISQLGFETNKKRKILKGGDRGEEKIIRTNNKGNIILGTFGYFSKFLDSFGILYTSLNEYIKKYYIGYYELKFKLKKDEKFKNTLKEKINNLNDINKCLFNACLMPDRVFNEIMKFCLI